LKKLGHEDLKGGPPGMKLMKNTRTTPQKGAEIRREGAVFKGV